MLNRAELVSILRQAQEAGITPPPLDHSPLPPYAIKQMSKFVLTDRGIEDRLTNFLDEQAELELFQGANKLMNQGGGGATSVGIGSVAQSLLAKTRQYGPEKAVGDLEKFLAAPATPGYEILAISGIVIDTAIDLGNRIVLVPIQELPPSDAKDHLVDTLRTPASVMPIALKNDWSRPKAALISSVNFAPKTFEHSTDHSPSLSGPQRYSDLEDACLLLTLARSSSPISVAYWTQVEDWVPCAQIGWSLMLPTHDVGQATPKTLSGSDGERARENYEAFLRLDKETRQHLRVPIQRLNQARRRAQLTDQAIELGIALESLLLKDRDPGDPIALPFRLRGAWLLGGENGPTQRLELLNLFDDIYSLRSQAVHAGALSQKANKYKTKKTPAEIIAQAFDLCSTTIEVILKRQSFPDDAQWAEIILGGFSSTKTE